MYGCARVEVGVGVGVGVPCVGEWGLDVCARVAVVVSVSVHGRGVGGVWEGCGWVRKIYFGFI